MSNGSGHPPGEVYISGALTALENGARERLFYELLAEIVESNGFRAYLPHRVSDPVAAPGLEPRAVYELDRLQVRAAPFVVTYAGVTSFGVGMELEIAREHGVPAIVVVEKERTVSRMLLGSPAVVEVVRFADLEGLRRLLGAAIARLAAVPRGTSPQASDDVIVQRFLASLEHTRRLPEAELAALLRVAELDGDLAGAVLSAVRTGALFGAGLRDLVGRHALRGTDLALFVVRDVLERPLAEAARLAGLDARTVRRRLEGVRARLGLADGVTGPSVGQWLVTELIAPPTRALQLHLFTGSREHSHEQGTVQEEDHRQAGVAFEEGQPWA